MRLIHTSDWHLGRIFFGYHLTEDQAHVLEQFVQLVRDSRPDAVLIAGDIYDRSVPPVEAVRLLDHVLSEIVRGIGVPVIAVAGNHDSPERLAFGSGLLQKEGLHIAGTVDSAPLPVVLEDEVGPVAICPIPYAEPALVREAIANTEISGHAAALGAQLAAARERLPQPCRSVAVAHAFVAGGEESESERPLSVGGSGRVEASVFDGFDFTALGHLHRPQSVGHRIRYAGSLLKYSFSEAGHAKSVDVVEIGADGSVMIEPVALIPRRDMRLLEGRLEDLLAAAESDPSPEDFIMATLTDREARFDVMGKLRRFYPNVLHVERLRTAREEPGGTGTADRLNRSEEEICAAFFKEVTGEELSEAERAAMAGVLESVWRAEREAGA